jgi:hypothetical protein
LQHFFTTSAKQLAMLFEDPFYLRRVDVYNAARRDLHSLNWDAL